MVGLGRAYIDNSSHESNFASSWLKFRDVDSLVSALWLPRLGSWLPGSACRVGFE